MKHLFFTGTAGRPLRVITLFLALTFLFSACAVTGLQAQRGGSPATAAPPENTAVLKFYTDSDDATNTQRQYALLISRFEKAHPGVRIQMASLTSAGNYDEYRRKCDLMLAGGEQLDVFRLAAADEVARKADMGQIAPMDDYALRERADLGSIYKGIQRYKGKVYSISDEITPWLVFINKDMLDKAGLPVPPLNWTWADYRTYASRLTAGSGEQKVYGSYMHTWVQFLAVGAMSKLEDVPIFTRELRQNFDNPVFSEGLKFRYDLENQDHSQVPYFLIKSRKLTYRNVFFSGQAAMVPMGAWLLSDIPAQDKYPHTFRTTFAAWPRWDSSCAPNTSLLDGTGMGWSINAASGAREEAYQFIRLLTTEGAEISRNPWSAWKESDTLSFLQEMIRQNPGLYDAPALLHVLFDPDRHDNLYQTVGPAQTSISEGPWTQESEKYLMGNQGLDVTMEHIRKSATALIEQAK